MRSSKPEFLEHLTYSYDDSKRGSIKDPFDGDDRTSTGIDLFDKPYSIKNTAGQEIPSSSIVI